MVGFDGPFVCRREEEGDDELAEVVNFLTAYLKENIPAIGGRLAEQLQAHREKSSFN